METANHKFVVNPTVPESRICSAEKCGLPLSHPVHGKGRVMHGTATPKKLG